jgi:YVTN family beta-propeller protein
VLICSLICLATVRPALATRLPAALRNQIVEDFPGAKIRLDGAIETKTGELYLPVIPDADASGKNQETKIESKTIREPNIFSCGNGWFYLRVLKRGQIRTVSVPADLPEGVRKSLLSCKLSADLIVPESFALPKSLKSLAGELDISIIDDVRPNPAPRKQAEQPKAPVHGAISVSSPSTGKITLLNDTTLEKIADFQTEGTPCGMAYAAGKIYIADVSKNRVLKLDPKRKQFIGQINLPGHSAPKGVATLPDGKLLYVSESGTNNVAVFEVENEKLLVRTKVLPGPTRMAITPNGEALLVLNAPSGKVTVLSTQTQKVLGIVTVGTLPNAIAMSEDSEHAYVSSRVSNTVSVIDISKHKVIETLKTGAGPTGLTLDGTGTKLFVANAKDNTISVFDLEEHTKLDDIKLPLDVDFPGELTLLPDKSKILVSSESTEAIGILSVANLAFESQPVIGHTSDEFLWVPLKGE